MADYTKIAASSPVLYIKLGDGGSWEQECIEKGIIRFGYLETSDKALRGDWAGVRDYWSSQRKSRGAATRDLDQIRNFFESAENTIWITFYDRFLWWCRAKSEPKPHPDGGTYRQAVDGWSNKNVVGDFLNFEKLSGKLLKTQACRCWLPAPWVF